MFETVTKAKRLEKAKELFMDAVDYDRPWQSEAFEDFQFRDGHQWSQKEKEILAKEKRPALTFNVTKSSVDLVMGMNEDNRVVFKCSPQESGDELLCEVLNILSDWSQETFEFADEEDAALESATICGRGFVGVDFRPNPKQFGDIILELMDIPVHEVRFDPSARRSGYKDASYLTWDRWMSVEDFHSRFPKYPLSKIESLIETGRAFHFAGMADSPGGQAMFERQYMIDSDTSDYDTPLDLSYYDRARKLVRVIHMEYWQSYKRYYGFNPETNQFEEFDGSNLKAIKKAYLAKHGMEFQHEILIDKKVKWLQFIGDEILYDGDSPLPYDGFSIVPMIAFRDVSQRTANHFGLVRLMKDPQREVNKRWSQALNLLNQSSQPGVFAEVDAFLNLDQAILSMKDPGSATLLNSGGLNKFKERSMPAFPSAPMQMEEFSQDIMRKITGINPDLLGQDRGRQEPGVVVRLRQQQGIILMKPLFKSFHRMRKRLFKRIISIIMQYMSNEQIIRVLGESGKYQIDPQSGMIVNPETGLSANIRDLRNTKYNIKAEEAPGNMTKRTLELTTFLEMQQTGFPVDPNVVINRLDLPVTEKLAWMKYISDQMTQQAQMQDQTMQLEAQFKDRELSAEEQKVVMEFLIDLAKVNQQAQKDEVKADTAMQQIAQADRAAVLSYLQSLGQREAAKQEKPEKKK